MSSYIFPGCLPSTQMTQEVIDAEQNLCSKNWLRASLSLKRKKRNKTNHTFKVLHLVTKERN